MIVPLWNRAGSCNTSTCYPRNPRGKRLGMLGTGSASKWPKRKQRCQVGFLLVPCSLRGRPWCQAKTQPDTFAFSLKSGCTRVLAVVPLLRHSMQRELRLYVDWFNQDRPHSRLAGATPAEMYYGRRPACRAPRLEPCAAWPRASPCARPQTLIKGQPGVRLQLKVQFVAARRHLPRIELICAA